MARKSNTRAAQGSGTIRQRKDGRWEARYTVGRDPGTGKQIQKSVYGATQQEVRKKLAQATTAIDSGIECVHSFDYGTTECCFRASGILRCNLHLFTFQGVKRCRQVTGIGKEIRNGYAHRFIPFCRSSARYRF